MIFQQKNVTVHIVEPQYAAPEFPEFHHMDVSDFPLRASLNSAVFHYDQVSESGPAKTITFNQLGSFEIPDLKEYANTCELLQFSGRIHSARSVYEIAHQLPKVQQVNIFVDSTQSTYTEEKSKYFFRPPPCPNVKTLAIIMNLDDFYDQQQQCGDENGLAKFVESSLMHAGHSFPNLQNLELELPENLKLRNTVESLVSACPGLKTNGETDIIKLSQADDMTFSSSDESECRFSDNSASPDPWFSANQLSKDEDDAAASSNADVSTRSSYQQIMSAFSDEDSKLTLYNLANVEVNPSSSSEFALSYFCESVEQLKRQSLAGSCKSEKEEEHNFNKLHLGWIVNIVN